MSVSEDSKGNIGTNAKHNDEAHKINDMEDVDLGGKGEDDLGHNNAGYQGQQQQRAAKWPQLMAAVASREFVQN